MYDDWLFLSGDKWNDDLIDRADAPKYEFNKIKVMPYCQDPNTGVVKYFKVP